MYRDPGLGLLGRRRELVEQRRREIEELPPGPSRVHARRVAREAAAIAAIAVTTLLSVAMMVGLPGLSLAPAVPAAALVAGVIGWTAARARLARAIRAVFEPTFDVVADVDRLERTTPRRTLLGLCDREEPRSVVLPVIARAIAIPFVGAWVIHAIGPRVGQPIWIHDAFDVLPLSTLGGTVFLALLLGRDMRIRTVAALGERYCPAPSDAQAAAVILYLVLATIFGAAHVSRVLCVPSGSIVIVPLALFVQAMLAAPLASRAYTVARDERERLGLV
jgi:hypothetical protein